LKNKEKSIYRGVDFFKQKIGQIIVFIVILAITHCL
jgi:hypothetical protein